MMSSQHGNSGSTILKSNSAMLTPGKTNTAPPRSPSVATIRAHSKDRSRKASGNGCVTVISEPGVNASTSSPSTTTSSTTTTLPSTTTISSTTSTSNTTSSTTNTTTTTTTPSPSPTANKTSSQSRSATSSPLLRSTSPLTRVVPASNPTSRNGSSNISSSSNHHTRSNTLTTTTATHLSPWTGTNTFTTNSSNKKTAATADSRLVVLGSPAVGKSALVVRLLTGRFIWEYDPTLEATYRHHTTIDDDAATMDILDTAGLEENSVNEVHARWGDGFVLAFSLTDRKSFNALTEIHASVAAARQTPNFSCVIIANKLDLGHLAEVTEDEAQEVAGELGVSLFLTSACDGSPSIPAAFCELHRDVVRRRWTRRRRSSAKTVIEGFYKMFSR